MRLPTAAGMVPLSPLPLVPLVVVPLLVMVMVMTPPPAWAISEYQLTVDAGEPFPPWVYHMQTAPATAWSLPLPVLSNFSAMSSSCE